MLRVARQMGMRHGLLRALRSSLPLRSALNERPPDVQRPAILKTPQIRPFFCEKWLLFGVLRDTKSRLPAQAQPA